MPKPATPVRRRWEALIADYGDMPELRDLVFAQAREWQADLVELVKHRPELRGYLSALSAWDLPMPAVEASPTAAGLRDVGDVTDGDS